MIEKLNHFPVNWIDGMKINKNHFLEVQNFVSDSVRDSVGIHTSMINYGLLPVAEPIKMNLIIDNPQITKDKSRRMSCHHAQWFKNRHRNIRKFEFIHSLS